MRSQKINNRAPRPFKNKNSDRWSGVRDQKPFFAAPKPVLRTVKPGTATTENKSTGAAESPCAPPELPAEGK